MTQVHEGHRQNPSIWSFLVNLVGYITPVLSPETISTARDSGTACSGGFDLLCLAGADEAEVTEEKG